MGKGNRSALKSVEKPSSAPLKKSTKNKPETGLQSHPLAGIFPLLYGEDFDRLVEDIRKRGLEDPITLFHGLILDGRNRYRACRKIGLKPKFVEYTGNDPQGFVVSKNVERRHLSESQRAMCAGRLAQLPVGANQYTEGGPIGPPSTDAAAATLNVSATTVKRARSLLSGLEKGEVAQELVQSVDRGGPRGLAVSTAVKLAKALPGIEDQKRVVALVNQGVVAPDKALSHVKLNAKRDLPQQIRSNPIVTPDGRYQVIAIDPPWKYESRAEDATHRGRNPYPDMTVEEICALPVGSMAQDDCVLWLWTTNSFMREAYQCLDAWGFKDKTILTWDKELIGMGDWLRNVTEHCILAVRGKPVVALTNETTLIREKRREHSRKPEAFYELVDRLCPGSKLEMFAREARKGWAQWGAEKEKFNAGTKRRAS